MPLWEGTWDKRTPPCYVPGWSKFSFSTRISGQILSCFTMACLVKCEQINQTVGFPAWFLKQEMGSGHFFLPSRVPFTILSLYKGMWLINVWKQKQMARLKWQPFFPQKNLEYQGKPIAWECTCTGKMFDWDDGVGDFPHIRHYCWIRSFYITFRCPISKAILLFWNFGGTSEM